MEEALIEMVRDRPCLYDTKSRNYRDQQMRTNAWEEIGKELAITPEKAKQLWDRLRRCFANAVRRRRNKRSGDAARSIVPWRYEGQMGFLLPTLGTRQSICSVSAEDCINSFPEEDTSGGETVDELGVNDHAVPGTSAEINEQNEDSPGRKRAEDSLMSEIAQILRDNSEGRKEKLEAKESSCELDEVEMFFLSLAKTTKTLPLVEQAKLKLKISQMVLETQIAVAEQRNQCALAPSPAVPDAVIVPPPPSSLEK